jgi:hypothetical protein
MRIARRRPNLPDVPVLTPLPEPLPERVAAA